MNMTKSEYIEWLVSVKGWTRTDAELYANLFNDEEWETKKRMIETA